LERYHKALKEGSFVDDDIGTISEISDGDVTGTGATGDIKDVSAAEKVFNPVPEAKIHLQ
jgi:hypothetical protein